MSMLDIGTTKTTGFICFCFVSIQLLSGSMSAAYANKVSKRKTVTDRQCPSGRQINHRHREQTFHRPLMPDLLIVVLANGVESSIKAILRSVLLCPSVRPFLDGHQVFFLRFNPLYSRVDINEETPSQL